jgi:hypothetical protein
MERDSRRRKMKTNPQQPLVHLLAHRDPLLQLLVRRRRLVDDRLLVRPHEPLVEVSCRIEQPVGDGLRDGRAGFGLARKGELRRDVSEGDRGVDAADAAEPSLDDVQAEAAGRAGGGGERNDSE